MGMAVAVLIVRIPMAMMVTMAMGMPGTMIVSAEAEPFFNLSEHRFGLTDISRAS
ncbi:hypothetical protein FP2506_00210 [Fulvimarina pelagi HTCC2506]|uniref:Uncharacterized protein n=1 Tax=Fulvimarina pelagi HTCC2506 TaxID=314231 RepID=Q0FXU3_9HYPH|nr:hypothetical protein FP2506_00210 [Fulvimarina pelagi HTCC2506]